MEKILIDIEEQSGAVGVIMAGKEILFAGLEVSHLPEREWDRPEIRRLRENGVEPCLRQARQDFPFYPVPRLEVFAVDGAGGCFALIGGGEESCPVGYLPAEGGCLRVADCLEEFLALAEKRPDWRKTGTPAQVALYPDREAAARDFRFFPLPENI
jgi:hypothetical protein